MLEVSGQERGAVLEVTTQGTATKEDLQKFENTLKEKTFQEEPVNILFIFKNIDGITPKALWEDIKIMSYLKSIEKGALVSDKTFMQIPDKIQNIFPGVEVTQYPLEELDAARKWVQN